jgi:hypothetical protein
MAFSRPLSFLSAAACAALLGSWLVPAGATVAPGQGVSVDIKVYVSNANDGSPVPEKVVYYEELGESCYIGSAKGAHYSASELTNAEGIAEFRFVTCKGAAAVYAINSSSFEAQVQEFIIVPGQSGYQITMGLTPKGQRSSLQSNKYLDQTYRTLHIRVQGRLANGSLVPVHFATVYDSAGRHIVTTDYNGNATAYDREAMGETVTMQAQGSHWREATSSFIVGASEHGTNFTRNDDYVNFVLNGDVTSQLEDLELAIRVRGKKNTKQGWTTVHFASIYDAAGKHLGTTDYNGMLTVKVKATLGEPYVVKVDATHWKPASEEVLVGSIGAGGTVVYNHVDFMLNPEVEAKSLTVEVLNHDTDKPAASATVTLYKPTGFPGTAVGHATTNGDGLATFDAEEIDSALLNGQAHVAASHGGSKSSVQTIAASLLQGDAPKYLIYLTDKAETTAWSGTWYDGPYTMQLSGGTGSLGFTSLRHTINQCASGCFDLVDQGGGSCTVKGSVATCQWQMHYTDGAKDVQRSGHSTLTFVGGPASVGATIHYHFVQDTGTIKLATGTCPDINICTAMHPGSINDGYWTRKKP